MRSLLTFDCEGRRLAGTIDRGDGRTGLLMVTGGSQTRIGSHRMYERLAFALAQAGHDCFRFDRRGVGDSEGEDPDFKGSAPDLVAAARAFRAASPGLERMIGFGLCDGASSLALFGGEAGLDGIILANPWMVETDGDGPAPAAISRHYRRRLLSLDGWKRLISGSMDFGKAVKGLRRILKPGASGLADEMAFAMERSRLPAAWILAEGDMTANAAHALLKSRRWKKRITTRESLCTDSHTFARFGDDEKLEAAVRKAIGALAGASAA